MAHNGADAGALAELEQRVSNLENGLNELQNLFARWMKEMQDSLN